MKMLIALTAGAMFLSSAANAQLHDYEFTNGLTDSVAGGVALAPSVSPGNPTATYSVTGGNYVFDSGAGLFLGAQLPGSVYTIDTRVAFNDVSGYRKLISFGNIATDRGLYNQSGYLNLFNVKTSSSPTDFVAGQFVDVQISRDAAGLVTGYIGGVLSLSYDDSTTQFFTPTADANGGQTGSGLWFFRDDTDQNGEQSSGMADYLRIYGTATIPAAVPESSTWALMILGLGAIGFATRRRRTVTVRFAKAG